GFRFDEGSILARGEDGTPLVHPPVIWQIELDDTLADTKVIAEAWDAAGLYQVGHFPGDRWAEWNGRYRDDVRRFVKGDAGLTGAIASRLGGSADIYQMRGQTPANSINFITVHDGFTLNDLVSYNTRLNSPGFDDPQARTLACTIAGFGGAADLHVMMNMFWEPLDFEVPAHSEWQIAIDTFAASPHDIADPDGHEPMVRQHTTVNGR